MKILTSLTKLMQLIKAQFDALPTVAKSGNYDDLANKPEVVEAQTITLAEVATSGSYNDLANKPAVPTASSTVPQMAGDEASVGIDAGFARGDHKHPHDDIKLNVADLTEVTNTELLSLWNEHID